MSHLEDMKESYSVHFGEAVFVSLSLFKAAFACLIHAFLPFIFTKTASSTMRIILQRTDDRYAG